MPTPPKLGIIAGAGQLPLELAETCRHEGRSIFVLALDGICDTSLLLGAGVPRDDIATAGLAQIGRMDDLLRQSGCGEVILAGRVVKPDFSALVPDWAGVKLLPRVVAAAAKGDDALLRVLIGHLEGLGLKVVGIADVAQSLLAPEGLLGAVAPRAVDQTDIVTAARAADDLGARDAGQAAVARQGQVIALEDDRGTDAMLAGIAPPEAGMSGVLAKVAKPIQDRRVDLPTIGVQTIVNAKRAGLAGIAVEAGAALVVDRKAVVRMADAEGLFITGIPSRQFRGSAS